MSAPHEANAEHESAAVYQLMAKLSTVLNESQVDTSTAVLALAKLLGQTAVVVAPTKPAVLLDCACQVARREMCLRATAQAFQAAGLGALMPVRPV